MPDFRISSLTARMPMLPNWMKMPAFENRSAEKAFWERQDEQRYGIRRACMLVGILIFSMIAVIDWLVWPSYLLPLTIVRSVTVLVMSSALIAFLKSRTADERELAVMVYLVAAVVGQIAMSLISPAKGVVYYQFGLAAILIYGFDLIFPRFRTSKMLVIMTAAIYAFALPYTSSLPVLLFTNTVIITVISLSGLVGAFERERIERLQTISEIKLDAALHEAETSRDAAVEANQAKDQFLASVSHELRTPLNAILGFSDVMKNEVFGPVIPQQYKDYVDHIHHSGKLLQTSISDLLDLTRLEAGKMGWTDTDFDLNALLADTVATCESSASEAGVKLVQRRMRSKIEVHGDPIRLGQAVINLVMNAIKFSDGGSVTIGGSFDRDGDFTIFVSDTGRGISPEKLEMVRRPFTQAHADSDRKGGLGLGLAIVSGIMERFEGRLDLVSKVRAGTTASLTIPKKRISGRRDIPLRAPTRDTDRRSMAS